MTKFIKTKFNISNDKTIIDCKYYRISYHIKINRTMNHYYKLLWSSESIEVKYNIGFGIPIEIPSQRKKRFKSAHKQEIGLLWSSGSFEGKYNIVLGIPIKFSSQRKKIFRSVQKQEIGRMWSSE